MLTEVANPEHATNSTSIAKAFAAEAIFRIVDRSVQMCGGLEVSDDLALARLSRGVRPFRIYDGPSEVHRWTIAERVISAAERAQRSGK
ncbi:acyl-CoA dehydrogenase family protein [Nocardia beijingensis]|uniref:acyl-CoA dehydrogenase family protein n=1 Tax=Nocardia beijingensis TaxID=95162 RepID=UPI003D9F2B20